MKLAVISDIHGNTPALRAVLAEAARAGADRIVALGDLFGPENTQAVLAGLRAADAFVIRGNGERYQLERGDWENWDQYAALLAIERELGTEGLQWITALPVQASLRFDAVSLRLTHGSPKADNDPLTKENRPALRRALRLAGETVVLCGHTHSAFLYEQRSRYVCNVGSVGMNHNGDFTADMTLLTIKGGEIACEQRRVPYDFAERRRTAGDLPWAKLTLRGIETGENLFLRFMREAQKRGGGKWPVPNDIWRRLYAEWTDAGLI